MIDDFDMMLFIYHPIGMFQFRFVLRFSRPHFGVPPMDFPIYTTNQSIDLTNFKGAGA